MDATQYAQTIRVIDTSNEMPYTKAKAVCVRLQDLIGYDQAREIAAQCMERSFVGGYLSYITLLKELQFEYNRIYALTGQCACENCEFIRTEWAWIGAKKVRLELEEMTPGYAVTVQESIDHETERMNKVIMEGCHMNKYTKKQQISNALTWNELADMYDKFHGGGSRSARTLRMETVFDWAKKQPEIFYNEGEGTLHHVIK